MPLERLTKAEVAQLQTEIEKPVAKAESFIQERFGVAPEGLKDFGRVEALIGRRESVKEDLERTVEDITPTEFAERPLRTTGRAGLAGLQTIGLGSERLESVAANPLLAVQEASPLPVRQAALTGLGAQAAEPLRQAAEEQRLPFQISQERQAVQLPRDPVTMGAQLAETQVGQQLTAAAQEAPSLAVAGATGERLGKFGDVIRREDLGPFEPIKEPLAATVGLFSSLGLDLLAANSVGLLKAITKVSRQPVVSDKTLLNFSKEVNTYVKGLKKDAGSNIALALDGVDDAAINVDRVRDLVASLPDNIQKGIKGLSPKATLVKIRQLTQKAIPDKVFTGAREATPIHGEMIQLNREAGNILAENSPQVRIAWQEYKNVMDTIRGVSGILHKNGNLTASRLANLFRGSGAEKAGERLFFEQLQKTWPRMIMIIRSINKFNTKQAIVKGIQRTLPWVVGTLYLGGRVGGRAGAAAGDVILPEG